MMDFNLILLIAGLGLLALVLLFALWGFLAGFKRELSCTLVFIILLVLAWLVFGNSGVLLNYDGGLVGTVRNMLNLPAKDATLWETVLDFLRNMDGLNLESLLVEGKETYDLVYSITSGVATLALLFVSTLAIIIITPIIRLLSHFVILIIKGVKRHRARSRRKRGIVAEEKDKDPVDETANDSVLVLHGIEEEDDAIVTISENQLPKPKKTKKRLLGALTGALKGAFLIILLFAPISGIYSIASSATPETRELISDLVSGDTNKEEVAGGTNIVDTAFDIVDAYGESGIGKFVEGSSYFFGESVSTLFFDSMFAIETKTQNIKLREELIAFINAINALNGNIEIGTWTPEEVQNALNALKDSKLLPEIMPAGIEFASELEMIKNYLEDADQVKEFLALTDINWDKDLELIFDAIAQIYALEILPIENEGFLTMDPEGLRKALGYLGETELFNAALPIGVKIAFTLDMVKDLVGEDFDLDASNIDWGKELLNIVDIYEAFLGYGIESMDELTGVEMNDLVERLVVENFATTVKVLEELVETQLFTGIVVPVLDAIVDNKLGDGEYGEFVSLLDLKALTVEDWKEDFTSLVTIAKLAVDDLNALSLDIKQMDIESDDAIAAMKTIIQELFTLNILGDDSTKNQLIHKVLVKFDLVNEEDILDENKNSIFANINWENLPGNPGEIQVFLDLVDAYAEFIKLEGVDITNFDFDIDALLENEESIDVIVSALEAIIESEVIINLVSPLVNKYVLPITNEFDDDNLVSDIVSGIGSKAVAEEIVEIIKAFKSAQNLGLFQVPSKGLGALKYENVDDIKHIINTIFDSQLFEGFEGRIIRIIFKATKLLDIEKGLLEIEGINYDDEQAKLIGFIDELAYILQDPEFKLVDEEGNIDLDLEYLTKHENFKHIMDAFAIIVGTYTIDEEGNFIESEEGSKIIEALLPDIYKQYVKDMVPADFQGLVDILGLENFTGAELAGDIRHFMFIAQQLVEMDVQNIIVGKPIEITNVLDNVSNIIDAFLDMHMFANNGSEIMAWGYNYAKDMLAGSMELPEVSAEDFDKINWREEGETAKGIIAFVIDFLVINDLTTSESIMDFVSNQGFLENSFITTENVNDVIDILSQVLTLQTVEVVLEIGFKVVVDPLVEDGTIDNFWENGMTGEQLAEDVQAIVNVLSIVVNNTDILEYYKADFNCDIEIPSDEVLNQIIDELAGLNLLVGNGDQLFAFIINKVGDMLADTMTLPVVEPSDFEDYDWRLEVENIKDIVTSVIDLLFTNELKSVDAITEWIESEGYRKTSYVTTENLNKVIDIVSQVLSLQTIEVVLGIGFDGAIDMLVKDGTIEDFWNGEIEGADLAEDLQSLVDILDIVVNDSKFVEYWRANFDCEIEIPEVTIFHNILDKVFNLNLIDGYEAKIFNFALGKVLTDDSIITLDDLKLDSIENWDNEFDVIKGILTVAFEVLENNNINTLDDLMNFDLSMNNLLEHVNDTNVNFVADLIDTINSSKIVENVLPAAIRIASDMAADAGYDVSFLEDLTGSELSHDIGLIADIIRVVGTLRVEDFIVAEGEFTIDYETRNLDELFKAVQQIINHIGDFNLITKHDDELFALILNEVFSMAGLTDISVSADDYKDLTPSTIFDNLHDIVEVVRLAAKGNKLVSVKNGLDYIEDVTADFMTAVTGRNVNSIADIIIEVSEIELLIPVLPQVVKYALGLAELPLDLSFLETAVDNGDLSGQALCADIASIGYIVKELVAFGALDIYKDNVITEVKRENLTNVFNYIGNLNIFTCAQEEWAASIFNFAFETVNLGYDKTYTADDFSYLTDELWAEDFTAIADVVYMLSQAALEVFEGEIKLDEISSLMNS